MHSQKQTHTTVFLAKMFNTSSTLKYTNNKSRNKERIHTHTNTQCILGLANLKGSSGTHPCHLCHQCLTHTKWKGPLYDGQKWPTHSTDPDLFGKIRNTTPV